MVPVAFTPILQTGDAATMITPSMLVVFGIILLALVFFSIERIPVDLTAIFVMVILIVLEPWTQISPTEGISGFSNAATVTVLAMLILSAGISKTGAVQHLGNKMAAYAGTNRFKQLAVTIFVGGPPSGVINNTPVVAILVPVITDLAHRGKSSPSKLLMPLSFASMLGGMLTVIGTSTNILASDVWARQGGPTATEFSMFEFTHLGLIVLIVGSLYLLTIGYRLLPERIPAQDDYIDEYELEDYLTEIVIGPDSPLVGQTISTALINTDYDLDVLQIDREGDRYIEPLSRMTIHATDVLKLRANRDIVEELLTIQDIQVVGAPVTDAELEPSEESQTLVEVVIPSGSPLVGETLRSSRFRQKYDANVLAFRSRGRVIRDRLDQVRIRVGDTVLVQANEDSIDRLSRNPEFVVAHEPDAPSYRTNKIPHAILIILGVVLLPALGVLPIVVSALGGVVAMAVTGVLKPTELYESVDWNVIFLLAGVIPLGIAFEKTGAADLLGHVIGDATGVLPLVVVLWVFYITTSLLTNLISNNASVVLMIPVAIQAAVEANANAFAFVIAVTFAASTAFMTPVGYQTNLFVYGPGGYRFTDFIRVGAPLQFILSIVTVIGIVVLWGL